GLEKCVWPVASTELTLDETFDAWRAAALRNPVQHQHLDATTLDKWVDALFLNPLVMSRLAKNALANGTASEEESNFLEQIIETSQQEQKAKDAVLMKALTGWFEKCPDGKAVIFCGESSEAAFLSTKLQIQAPWAVVRHSPDLRKQSELPDDSWQVLICDRRGEDGLNLHGKNRLAVHYSLSRDFNRFEQRLGRFNRYSGNLRGVKPVKSLILLPERDGLRADWVKLLDEGTGLFHRSVASLQFVLSEQLEMVWRDYVGQGLTVFHEAQQRLSGENGFIAQERKRVLAQENLLSMEQEVIAAREFSEQLAESEDEAEAQAKDMLTWMRKALGFKREQYSEGGFRLRFERGE
ncbi:helicase SNF2, partial [Klebsiella aerogenes]